MSEQVTAEARIDPAAMLRPRRPITGMSAILLPLLRHDDVDWKGFDQHVHRTFDAGLIPAVNMDTGYANLISETVRQEVLERTQSIAAGRDFVAGVFVGDAPGANLAVDAYQRGIDDVHAHSGTPILFQSFGLTEISDDGDLIEAYARVTRDCDRFLAFELGQMFAPFGRVYSLEAYRRLIQLPACVGAKHSSLSRSLEWQRLQVRDQVRPDFLVLTGNDLAIDMVMYGSDYLLGLSTFAPDAFAVRDRWWRDGDQRYYELNDVLQYLGAFAFRPPVPAYKHSAAMFLQLRYGLATDRTHPRSPTRPDSDREVLALINETLTRLLES